MLVTMIITSGNGIFYTVISQVAVEYALIDAWYAALDHWEGKGNYVKVQ